ncbi:MAG: hypothetical protein KAQ83_02995 [Nanoarchaeota archaeon]|nr:hypothetical protein [Nanoarchaeota archaeon]
MKFKNSSIIDYLAHKGKYKIANFIAEKFIQDGPRLLNHQMIDSLVERHGHYDFAIQYAEERNLLEVYDVSEIPLNSTERTAINEEFRALIPFWAREKYFAKHRSKNGMPIPNQENLAHRLGLDQTRSSIVASKKHLDYVASYLNE